MVIISREEIMKLFENWSIDVLEQLEEILERQLTDDELKKMLLHVIGYYDFTDNETLGDLVDNIGIDGLLSTEEYEKIKNIEIE